MSSSLQLLLATNLSLQPWLWMGIGVLAALGLLALVSPHRFSVLATRGGHWVDTDRFFAALDKRIDVDQYVLPFSRILGGAVLAAAALFAVLLTRVG